jgi:hypothetical protein
MRGALRPAALAILALGAINLALIACIGSEVKASQGPTADTRADARATWEAAIRAKGGRERLHAVRNFVTMSREEFPRSPRPDVITHAYYEYLYILPNRLWQYEDYRPGKMGENGLALDMDQHRVLNQRDRTSAQGLFDDLVYRFRNGQFIYLMETAYVQPEPVALRTARLDRRDIDIIETRLNADRVEFSLDRQSHLPARIAIAEQKLHLGRVWRLSDYKLIDGIQMPANVHLGDDGRDREAIDYRFNVEYDESIFRSESVRFEKNGWMKR